MPAALSAASHAAAEAQRAIAQARSCSASMCSISCLKRRFRIESAPRGEVHLEWARARRLSKQREVPCLAALSCPPHPATLVSRASGRLLRRVLPSSIYHRGGNVCPGQTRLRSAARRACSPDTDGRGMGQFGIHDCLWQAQSTPRHSPQSACPPHACKKAPRGPVQAGAVVVAGVLP